jgi:hypothetical protein
VQVTYRIDRVSPKLCQRLFYLVTFKFKSWSVSQLHFVKIPVPVYGTYLFEKKIIAALLGSGIGTGFTYITVPIDQSSNSPK